MPDAPYDPEPPEKPSPPGPPEPPGRPPAGPEARCAPEPLGGGNPPLSGSFDPPPAPEPPCPAEPPGAPPPDRLPPPGTAWPLMKPGLWTLSGGPAGAAWAPGPSAAPGTPGADSRGAPGEAGSPESPGRGTCCPPGLCDPGSGRGWLGLLTRPHQQGTAGCCQGPGIAPQLWNDSCAVRRVLCGLVSGGSVCTAMLRPGWSTPSPNAAAGGSSSACYRSGPCSPWPRTYDIARWFHAQL